ncbi:ATP-dependent helicase HrpB [Paenibacillus sp. SC116]|uniref:ATP-dependent helicase HrpB n=1 Tax=Paenibacillus sp. SC116 TaxID=2968986 RepID=UPI00215A5EF9|nr:ATP-dependent helicase HrpB [Paenibacillus sp. SC116]MCR8844638.1 ATP-dependent helicase HrpB [Paenibacillus sp. SC116]
MSGTLPIDEVLPELRDVLSARTGAVLVAEPGAGKTTRVPLALLDAPWLAGRRIVMLEPRRLAARAAAQYMAATLGERVGETVGYRVRMDTRVSRATRVEVVTEGVLTRMMQEDPSLEGVGLIIFDEFHERSLHADLGLSLALEAQAVLREDLRLLVMSATIAAEPVAELLGDAPIVRSAGRMYPVDTRYVPRRVQERMEEATARQIEAALQEETGDMLVFLPGVGEIRRVQQELANILSRQTNSTKVEITQLRVLPLHGQLPQQTQDEAIAPAKHGERKVVLTTSIAETSLTVEGVRIVIDSGLMRVSRYSPRTGMTRLVTERVTQDAADQRRGRAGRLGPGVCYRLWSEAEHGHLAKQRLPEILDADLAPLALELAAWGTDVDSLMWLTSPPIAALQQAEQLLGQLGALDTDSSITHHGRQMALSGLHPRLAHMLLKAIQLGVVEQACLLAAMLQERDLLRGTSGSVRAAANPGISSYVVSNPDLLFRLELLLAHRQVQREEYSNDATSSTSTLGSGGLASLDEAVVRRIHDEEKRLSKLIVEKWKVASPNSFVEGDGELRATGKLSNNAYKVGHSSAASDASNLDLGRIPTEASGTSNNGVSEMYSVLLAMAYPDRVGKRRDDGRYLLSNGRGASFAGQNGGNAMHAGSSASIGRAQHPIHYAPYIVAIDLDDQGSDSRIRLAIEVTKDVLERCMDAQMENRVTVEWDKTAEAVRAREEVRLGAIVLRERSCQNPDADEVLEALMEGIARHPLGIGMLPWTKSARQLQARLTFLHHHRPHDWADASDAALTANMVDWLAPHLYGLSSRHDLQKLQVAALLEGLLPWNQRQQLDDEAPTHIAVPSGSRIAVDYTNPEQPVLAVRLQELFGMRETPRIAGGAVPLTLHLLSPAQRPVQVTQDLASFWQNTYFEVKKDLKGRYPKHYWPDDPLAAVATRRTKPSNQ